MGFGTVLEINRKPVSLSKHPCNRTMPPADSNAGKANWKAKEFHNGDRLP